MNAATDLTDKALETRADEADAARHVGNETLNRAKSGIE